MCAVFRSSSYNSDNRQYIIIASLILIYSSTANSQQMIKIGSFYTNFLTFVHNLRGTDKSSLFALSCKILQILKLCCAKKHLEIERLNHTRFTLSIKLNCLATFFSIHFNFWYQILFIRVKSFQLVHWLKNIFESASMLQFVFVQFYWSFWIYKKKFLFIFLSLKILLLDEVG